MKNLRLAPAIAVALSFAAHGASMNTTPQYPAVGDAVTVVLSGSKWPPYIPTTSYSRQGNTFNFEYDQSDGFTSGPAFGVPPLNLGELPPGTYKANARIRSLNDDSLIEYATSYFTVASPFQPDAYAAPAQPKAYDRWDAIVSSAYYLYPSSLRATVQGNVVSVSFEYEPAVPTTASSGPAGTTPYASLSMDGLAPGNWTLQFNGTPRGASGTTLQYTKQVTVLRASNVVEFYSEATGHYFMTAGPGEMASLDAPGSGWRRTGESFNAWLNQADAPSDAQPVCRFYSAGANSHFYTANASECQTLKSQEARERSGGKSFAGWSYEGIAFYGLLPQNGQCPADTAVVSRFYNNRAAQNDTNHRFPSSEAVTNAMTGANWIGEGAAFCSPR